MNFSLTHLSAILKYGGISFIAGAVNHGFFSETRSLWTAGLGVLFYLVGAWLEMRNHPTAAIKWRDVLGAGIVFSIGIGFFTGGLQHFPDSPQRSAWVVPLGFVLSVWAMYFMGSKAQNSKNAWCYGVLASVLVVAGALLAWRVLGDTAAGIKHDEHTHSYAAPVAAAGDSENASANVPASVREVAIEMQDNMRFSPEHLQVKQGETIRFTLKNLGKVRHEWVIGSAKELQEHAAQMKKMKIDTHNQAHKNTDSHEHAHGGDAQALSLAAGEQGTLTWTFNQAGDVAMACFELGHYEAGMRGVIHVM
ncbi:plastocyanin/azurin family copper-binding protein [Limnohabitans sp.]|uniref:cupredoxin domain-containing protein n=1 Tax=Limnohabitans sp. TaxID=1907725 RepID=UPI00286F5983|nr:plastocyanin/azurin family copper-binding protein [Limnohabitans sp.]